MPAAEEAAQTEPVQRSSGRARGLGARLDGIPVESVYLFVALVWGVLTVLITPVFQVPDEPAHYFRAWAVAQGHLLPERGYRTSLPATVSSLPRRLGSGTLSWNPDVYSPAAVLRLLTERIGDRRVRTRTSAGGYPPTGYIPQASAIEITRLLGRSPVGAVYLGRLLNLLTAVLMTYFALRILPFGKALVAVIALLPMVISQYSSLSPDALVLSTAFFFTALVVRWLDGRRLSWRHTAVLAGVAAIGLNVKPGYALLSLLVLALPFSAFASRLRWAVSAATVLIASALIAAVQLYLTYFGGGLYSSPGSGQEPARSGQLDFVLHHPWAFTKVLFATFDQLGFWFVHSAVGIFGWLWVPLPVLVVFFALLVIMVVFATREPVCLRWWQRAVFLITALASLAVISLAAYASWSPFTAPTISGLQGRYFLPLLPIGLLALYGLPLERRRVTAVILIGAAVVLAFFSLLALVRFYY